MFYYNSIKDLIGNTPLVKLNEVVDSDSVNLFAKLELFNPGGSVKDRTGTYMIEEMERQNLLKKGGTIIEATAGNTGLGIAMAALNKGYRIIFVVPEKFSEEKQILMKALGAEIISSPREEGMLGAGRKVTARGSLIMGWFPCAAAVLGSPNPQGQHIHLPLDGRTAPDKARAGRRFLGTNGATLWLSICLPKPGAPGP